MECTPKIRLAIADDQKLFLKGLKFIINDFENIELVMEAENGKVLIEKVAQDPPDVILMDLKMPVMDGIEATQYLKKHQPEIKIILLTMYNEERLIAHMMKIGANGYLLKDEEPEVVRAAIETVVAQGFYFNDYVSKALLKGVKSNQKTNFEAFPATSAETKLSRREVEVLQLICKEQTTAEIAQQLFISSRTVEGHRKKLLEKTGVKNTAGLVIYAYRNGLISTL